MALLFCDSFDHYNYADILKKWTTASTTGSMTFTYYSDAPGGGAYALNETNNNPNVTKQLATNYATGVFGGWFRFVSASSGAGLMSFMDSSTIQTELRIDSTGHLIVARNGTTLATAAVGLSASTWYFIEFKSTINNVTGTYEVRVNGAVGTQGIAATSGVNTRGAAVNNSFNQLTLFHSGNGGAPNMAWKGVYVLDTSGTVANDFIGPVRVAPLRPVGAGNYTQWTPNSGTNFAAVGEKYADGDTGFNASATVNNIDSFSLEDLPSGSGTVYGIQHVMEMRQDGGAARTVAPLQRSSGTDYAGTAVAMAASYLFYMQALSINPATAAAFSVSDVNGMEAGYKLIS